MKARGTPGGYYTSMTVGAYYYSWYSGGWLQKTPYTGDQPLLGEYDSSSSLVAEEHAKMMTSAGIGFAAISWGRECYDHVIGAMDAHGVKSCCLYESLLRSANGKTIEEADHNGILRDMEVLADYIADPAWFRIDGKPVVMLYVTRIYRRWDKLVPAMRDVLGDVFLVGDELFWGEVPAEKLRMFDAVTAYNMYRKKAISGEDAGEAYNAGVEQVMLAHSASCQSARVGFWPMAMPGYDDSYYRPQSQHRPIPRSDGKFFAMQLKMAKDLARDGVAMLTSFNEHYEGTGIEPTTSWGDKYLKMVKGIGG